MNKKRNKWQKLSITSSSFSLIECFTLLAQYYTPTVSHLIWTEFRDGITQPEFDIVVPTVGRPTRSSAHARHCWCCNHIYPLIFSHGWIARGSCFSRSLSSFYKQSRSLLSTISSLRREAQTKRIQHFGEMLNS